MRLELGLPAGQDSKRVPATRGHGHGTAGAGARLKPPRPARRLLRLSVFSRLLLPV